MAKNNYLAEFPESASQITLEIRFFGGLYVTSFISELLTVTGKDIYMLTIERQTIRVRHQFCHMKLDARSQP